MKKRILAAALAAVMLSVSATGCSQNSNTASGNAAAGASGAASAASGDTIKIGGLAPLTGSVSVYGIATNNGIKLAVDEANKSGGVLGQQIEYISYDEKGDATEAVNAYNKLVQNDQVIALVGDVTSTPTLAVAQAAAKDGLPMITATATAAGVTATGENIFRACVIDPFQGELMASYSAKKLGAKTAAILYNMADDYSLGVAEAYKQAAASVGIHIVAEEKYQTNDVDFKSQLTSIKSKNPDVVFIPVYYQDVALIAVQAKQLGITSKLMGVDGWDGVLDKIDKSNVSALDGTYYCSQYTAESTDQKVQDFIKNYKAAYNAEPNMFAVLGYDAMNMMIESIKTAGSTDSDAIIKAMAGLKFKGLTGDITFDSDRNPVKTCAIITIKDGAYKFVEYYNK
ncbi:MAG TPA: ABC transporter substrate-binding protein [Clostridiales bacterium]|nr:ABC transporter substrate-binding protein [Clostridiales bacterium]